MRFGHVSSDPAERRVQGIFHIGKIRRFEALCSPSFCWVAAGILLGPGHKVTQTQLPHECSEYCTPKGFDFRSSRRLSPTCSVGRWMHYE